MKRSALAVLLLFTIFVASCDRFRDPSILDKEKGLKESLFQIRHAINQYTNEKQHEPKALNDLVSAGYLRSLPTDPYTGRADTWQPEYDSAGGGVMDVHSGARGAGSNKVPYSQW